MRARGRDPNALGQSDHGLPQITLADRVRVVGLRQREVDREPRRACRHRRRGLQLEARIERHRLAAAHPLLSAPFTGQQRRAWREVAGVGGFGEHAGVLPGVHPQGRLQPHAGRLTGGGVAQEGGRWRGGGAGRPQVEAGGKFPRAGAFAIMAGVGGVSPESDFGASYRDAPRNMMRGDAQPVVAARTNLCVENYNRPERGEAETGRNARGRAQIEDWKRAVIVERTWIEGIDHGGAHLRLWRTERHRASPDGVAQHRQHALLGSGGIAHQAWWQIGDYIPGRLYRSKVSAQGSWLFDRVEVNRRRDRVRMRPRLERGVPSGAGRDQAVKGIDAEVRWGAHPYRVYGRSFSPTAAADNELTDEGSGCSLINRDIELKLQQIELVQALGSRTANLTRAVHRVDSVNGGAGKDEEP